LFNPEIKFAKSKGIDLPIMYVYLAGRICGEYIDKCIVWQKEIINHYRNYKPVYGYVGEETCQRVVGYESYPFAFLCALNSGEGNSVDKKGLTSALPANLIYDKDILSIESSQVVVANMEDYFEEGIEDLLILEDSSLLNHGDWNFWRTAFLSLKGKILNRRENFGTISEIAISIYLKKPTILIVPERRKEIFEKHPFLKRASVIITSVEQLLEEKWLQILYKSIAGAIYE
jgi:hypothetical protein